MALPPVPVYTQRFDAFTPLASLGQAFNDGVSSGQQFNANRQKMRLNDLAMDQERQRMAAPGEIAGAYLSQLGLGAVGPATMGGAPQPAQPMRMPQGAAGDLKGQFMSTVRGAGLTNPFGLAAVAATGMRESGFSPQNATRTWSDPSESGQPGTSGGIMSWRGPRLQAMQQFAQARGDRPDAPSVETQALFFAQEDPTLIQRLNAARSPDEAAQVMAQAWRFAGFNRPGGEAAARADLTRQFVPMFGGQADAPAPGAQAAQGQAPQPPARIARMLQSSNPTVQERGIAEYQAWEQSQAPREMDIREVEGRIVGVDPVTGQARDLTPADLPQRAGFRQATPEEAARFGVTGGQFGPDGRFYPVNPPSGMTVESDGAGGIRVVQGPGAGRAGGAFTEGQSKDNVFSTRARGALEVLEPRAGALTSLGERAMNLDPTGVVRRNQSDDFQIAQQAGEEFLQAILRKDTGAAITEQEQILYGRTYLPQPGDNPAVLEAKAAARRRALAAIEAGMSPTQMIAQERALQATPAANLPQPGQPAPQQQPAQQGEPPRIATDDQYNALPSGSLFVDPEGNVRQKP